MSNNYFVKGLLFFLFTIIQSSYGQTLMHYWNFNNNASVATITTPTQTFGGATLNAIPGGISLIDFAGGTGQNFSVLNLNAQNGDASGTHLRFNDPIGGALEFALPTTGYENIVVKFATRRSAQGAGTQSWSYSLNGTTFTSFTTITPNNGDPSLATLDFSAIAAADNNPNFKLKVEFSQAPGGTAGNNRFDNFTVQGTSLVSGGDTTAPTTTFFPIDGAINVVSTSNPTIIFNENVRLLNNDAITNTTIDVVLELRLNNASGELVPFDATFASNTITIIPSSSLTNNQLYYIALLPNTIEDQSDNAITTTQSASFTTANPSISSIDLSTYVRVGRYNLPEPTQTVAPANNLLCQEASAVTYNWDTDTLFITADGSTSVTQVSKTGQLIDTMTMALGSSPQGTDFYDTEGLTYIGNGEFVMSEERDRQLVKFTYTAGTTLTRANTQTVKIGTFVPNTGTEGLSFDPITNGYIILKEIDPIGIFQTNVDFTAGTATNGSPTTVNSVNLFDPALLGFTDVADVYALSNLPVTSGQSLETNLLVLSQENAQVVNIDRNGAIASTLTIVSDAGNPLNVASQQHEGITMDFDGNIYIVSENGGGDINHPQLWVYAPSNGINLPPTSITLTNTVSSILENSVTTPSVRVADIIVTDDGLGTNTFSLSGTDATDFQITGSSLYIKPGTVLDFETKTSYDVTVNVDDTTVGTTPDASVTFSISVTDVINETPQLPNITISEVAPWGSGNSPAAADWFEVTNNGATALDITGWKVDDSSNSFAASLSLTGITSIAPGESVIFIESSTSNPAATVIANFKSLWFGANPPTSLQVGTYQGSGIGLSTGGDAVNLYDANGNVQANVAFGASPTTLYKTFNNAIGLNNTSISQLSEIGINDAFAALNDTNEIGSPGSVGRLFVSEVAPWSSGNSPVAADWFEVTNTKAVAVDITGWKVDDSSQSPVAAVALNGITSINPGESVIFIETNDLPGKTTAFLNNWFGTNPTSGLRIGNYTGSGIGLSTGGDQVNLYNSSSVLQTSVVFGASPTTTYTTFDNAAGTNSLVTPITQMSSVGINGAFIAANSTSEIGSPGSITTSPCPTIAVTAIPELLSFCSGGTTTITISATGGRVPYTGIGTFTIGAGDYSFTVTDASGCSSKVSGTISEPEQLTTTTTITQVSPYTWPLNGITYSTTGVYTFNTVNGNGCTVINTLNLTIATNLTPTLCGSTLTTINQPIYANLVPGAQSYRFRVTDLTTNQVQTIDRYLRVFSLNQLTTFNFARTYSVEVAALVGGMWQSFGPACNVTSPSPLTQVQSSQCGSSLSSIGTIIYANNVPYAQGYKFRITNQITSESIEVIRILRDVRLNTIAGFTPELATTYSIEVAVQNRDGEFLPYGPICSITTPGGINTSKVDSSAKEFNIVAYPNPFSESFMLDITSASQNSVQVRVYDMLGKLIEDRIVDYSSMTEIEIGSTYSSGVYNVIISQGDAIKVVKMVKR
ncbi:MAG: SdiA-regulated domain-containing protein [Flavobacteriales bacterium]|nr:SdiA-regulated domain-containing protein [Flavobacteriales bacterium]